jgi:hypothetical protein
MNHFPKEIQQLIYWHLWKMNIHNCHKEILNAKLRMIDKIIEYHNNDNLRNYRWKHTRIDFYKLVLHSLHAKMIDNLKYYADIEYLHIYGEPSDIEAIWSMDMFNVFNKIYHTRMWHDLPDIPKGFTNISII